MKKIPNKLFPNINPCWKCGAHPIFGTTEKKDHVLKCPNYECHNSLSIYNNDLESTINLWNQIYNCEPFIPTNVHYLNTCHKCLHRLNCIFSRSLDGVSTLRITCDDFQLDENEKHGMNIESYMNTIKCYKKK